MSASPSAKALRLLSEGRVDPAGIAAVYEVHGDSATYRVVVGDGWVQCPCDAWREMCSHAQAAVLLHAARVDGVAATVAKVAAG